MDMLFQVIGQAALIHSEVMTIHNMQIWNKQSSSLELQNTEDLST
jgi:hypothetical protein